MIFHHIDLYLLLGFLLAAVMAALLASSCLFSIRSRLTVMVSEPAVITRVSSEQQIASKLPQNFPKIAYFSKLEDILYIVYLV